MPLSPLETKLCTKLSQLVEFSRQRFGYRLLHKNVSTQELSPSFLDGHEVTFLLRGTSIEAKTVTEIGAKNSLARFQVTSALVTSEQTQLGSVHIELE